MGQCSIYINLNLDMMEDSEGNIWVSIKTGLIKISLQKNVSAPITRESVFKNPAGNLFIIETFQLSSQTKGPENYVGSLYEDNYGNIWAGCANGLYVLKRGERTFVRLEKGENTGPYQPFRFISSILQVNKDSYLIGTEDGLNLLSNIKIDTPYGNDDIPVVDFSVHQILKGQSASS
jgi:ligand-binding sensor domain-containing protein